MHVLHAQSCGLLNGTRLLDNGCTDTHHRCWFSRVPMDIRQARRRLHHSPQAAELLRCQRLTRRRRMTQKGCRGFTSTSSYAVHIACWHHYPKAQRDRGIPNACQVTHICIVGGTLPGGWTAHTSQCKKEGYRRWRYEAPQVCRVTTSGHQIGFRFLDIKADEAQALGCCAVLQGFRSAQGTSGRRYGDRTEVARALGLNALGKRPRVKRMHAAGERP